MANYSDRIKPIDYGIHTYLENLLKRNYQIPMSCPPWGAGHCSELGR